MPDSIRTAAAAATCFFTLALKDRSSRTLVDHVAELRACVKEVQTRQPFRIDAMVVLPDHLHALWTLPLADGDISEHRMLVQQAFTQRLGGADPWQKGGWEHRIRDDDDFARHVEYIHFNPVKHGWVLRAKDWPYSSLHRFVRQQKVGPDWGISAAIEGQFGE